MVGLGKSSQKVAIIKSSCRIVISLFCFFSDGKAALGGLVAVRAGTGAGTKMLETAGTIREATTRDKRIPHTDTKISSCKYAR